jgi:hypothetical protein
MRARVIGPFFVKIVSMASGRTSDADLGEMPGSDASRPAPAAEMIVSAERWYIAFMLLINTVLSSTSSCLIDKQSTLTPGAISMSHSFIYESIQHSRSQLGMNVCRDVPQEFIAKFPRDPQGNFENLWQRIERNIRVVGFPVASS